MLRTTAKCICVGVHELDERSEYRPGKGEKEQGRAMGPRFAVARSRTIYAVTSMEAHTLSLWRRHSDSLRPSNVFGWARGPSYFPDLGPRSAHHEVANGVEVRAQLKNGGRQRDLGNFHNGTSRNEGGSATQHSPIQRECNVQDNLALMKHVCSPTIDMYPTYYGRLSFSFGRTPE